MYKVKRLAIMLGRLALPTCFSIECQSESEAHVLFGAKTWLGSDAKNRAYARCSSQLELPVDLTKVLCYSTEI